MAPMIEQVREVLEKWRYYLACAGRQVPTNAMRQFHQELETALEDGVAVGAADARSS